jgi:hypothetical protein
MLGLSLVAISLFLLAPATLSIVARMGFSIVEILSFLILLAGVGIGVMLPATNNACIELMPDKVASIVGLRQMFRMTGGALGVSIVTIILHLSGNPVSGFQTVFTTYGLGVLCAIPLVFLIPAGTRARG